MDQIISTDHSSSKLYVSWQSLVLNKRFLLSKFICVQLYKKKAKDVPGGAGTHGHYHKTIQRMFVESLLGTGASISLSINSIGKVSTLRELPSWWERQAISRWIHVLECQRMKKIYIMKQSKAEKGDSANRVGAGCSLRRLYWLLKCNN